MVSLKRKRASSSGPETPTRRATDRGGESRSRVGRGVVTISTVTIVGILFNIINSISNEARTALALAEQRGAQMLQIREDMETEKQRQLVAFAEVKGIVEALRQTIHEQTDDRFRGTDYERERARMLETLDARFDDLQHQLDQLSYDVHNSRDHGGS
jgi:hypothetical protein